MTNVPISTARETGVAVPLDMRVRGWTGGFVRYGLLLMVSLIFMLPFALAFFGGFKTNREVLGYPPTVVPAAWADSANWTMFFTGEVPAGADHLAAQVARCQQVNA